MLDLQEQIVAHLAVCAGVSLAHMYHSGDVSACHEALVTSAGDDEAANGVQVDAVDGSVDVLQHSGAQSVQSLRIVDGQDGDSALVFQNCECHYEIPPTEF